MIETGRPLSTERIAIAAALALAGAAFATSALAGLSVPSGLALAVALAAGLLVCLPLARRLPPHWDGMLRRSPGLCIAWALVTLAALLRLAGVAWFMVEPGHAASSAFWFDDFYIRHNCMSGYWHAAQLARDGVANLYDPEHYTGWEGRFKLDEFLYLPQFLILPRAAQALGLDFPGARALWFALEGSVLLGAMLAICRWIGGAAGRGAALLIPAVWLGSPVVVTLQVGNFQLAAIALSVLSMTLFQRGRPVAGGALLGFTLFKLFPGLLGVYLLVSRQWRAAAWTFAFSVVYTAIALAWMGFAPFEAFVQFELPRLASGDAWAFLELAGLEGVDAINDSIPGLAIKLKVMGLLADAHSAESVLAWAWTLLAVGATVLVGLRSARMSRLECVAAWIAILAVASYRSLFVPDHNGLFAPLWLLGIVAASLGAGRARAALVLPWLALMAVLPFGGMPLPGIDGRFALSTTSQLIAIVLCLWALFRRPTRLGEPADATAGAGAPAAHGLGAPVLLPLSPSTEARA